jgi:hypothetical protein
VLAVGRGRERERGSEGVGGNEGAREGGREKVIKSSQTVLLATKLEKEW